MRRIAGKKHAANRIRRRKQVIYLPAGNIFDPDRDVGVANRLTDPVQQLCFRNIRGPG